ncbi:hypothetical protein V6R21_01940 [Limibacter armeniacum]|uniref:hypothetical protein n=1 Tax=Limibacter armeniacum TaxID=466084 RepID=UPI002FE68B83
MDKLHPDLLHFKLISGEMDAVKIYEGVVKPGRSPSSALQLFAKCVTLYKTNRKGKIKTEVYFSTDTKMDGMKLLRIYRLRFSTKMANSI